MDKALASKIADALFEAGRFDLLEEAADTTASIVSMMNDGREEESYILPLPVRRHNVARKLDQRAVGSKRYRNLRKEKAMQYAERWGRTSRSEKACCTHSELRSEQRRLDRNGTFEDEGAEECYEPSSYDGTTLDDFITHAWTRLFEANNVLEKLISRLRELNCKQDEIDYEVATLKSVLLELDGISIPLTLIHNIRVELLHRQNVQHQTMLDVKRISEYAKKYQQMVLDSECVLDELRKVTDGSTVHEEPVMNGHQLEWLLAIESMYY